MHINPGSFSSKIVNHLNFNQNHASCFLLQITSEKMKEIKTEVVIEASPERVWKVLTDYENHPAWNPFIRSISGGKRENEKLVVSLKPPDGKAMTFHPKIIKFDTTKEFRWKGKLGVKGIFDGEHYFILEKLNSKRTRFTHGEKFSGILVPMMGGILEKTKYGFEQMNKAIKKESERGHHVH
jgi:hypothetical protein